MWYVIQVQSGYEFKTVELCNNLIESEIVMNCFVPLYEKMKKYGGQWHKKQEILFPGYMFVETEKINILFHGLKKVPKLTKVLGIGDEFVPVNEGEEQYLQDMLNEQYVLEMSVGYIIGDQVYIKEGPMKDFGGEIKKINRHKRIAIIEVEMFGRRIDISVGLEILEKIKEIDV